MFKRMLVATLALSSSLLVSMLVGSAAPAQALDNGASQTPPAGWSSWSYPMRSPTEAKFEAQAKGMHDSGTNTNSISRTLASRESALFKVTPPAGSTAFGGPLTSALSGRCTDVPRSVAVNLTQVTVYDCNGGGNQNWTLGAGAKVA